MRTDKDRKIISMISGHIHTYDVIIQNDIVVVTNEKEIVTKQKVQGMNDFLVKAKDIRLGWGFFPDFEVVYIYDKGDGNFGYGVNLQVEWFSEWGYAPFS